MTCPSCAQAQTQPKSSQFSPGCWECTARALALTGAHLESAAAGSMTEQYRTALDKCFGKGWQAGHESVKEWASKLKRVRL